MCVCAFDSFATPLFAINLFLQELRTSVCFSKRSRLAFRPQTEKPVTIAKGKREEKTTSIKIVGRGWAGRKEKRKKKKKNYAFTLHKKSIHISAMKSNLKRVGWEKKGREEKLKKTVIIQKEEQLWLLFSLVTARWKTGNIATFLLKARANMTCQKLFIAVDIEKLLTKEKRKLLLAFGRTLIYFSTASSPSKNALLSVWSKKKKTVGEKYSFASRFELSSLFWKASFFFLSFFLFITVLSESCRKTVLCC